MSESAAAAPALAPPTPPVSRAATARPVLELSDVVKAFGSVQALLGVTIALSPWEILGLLGPNGAGKSTLISIIAGLLRPDRGTVCVAGHRVGTRGQRASVGLAPQTLGIYPTLSVAENLWLFGRLAGLRRKRLRDGMTFAAEALGLTRLLKRTAGTLSGGEQRRVHTAVALVHRPPLILLDEPTVGADIEMRMQLLHAVRELAAAGSAVIYTTHYLAEIEALNARVAILERGRIVADGALDRLIAAHGGQTLELSFHGPSPQYRGPERVLAREGALLRLGIPASARPIARVLTDLGPDAERLESLRVVKPSLEAVYLELMGRAPGVGGAADEP